MEHLAIQAALARLEHRLDCRLDRIERLISEGIGAYLDARFPHGDGRAGDRWSRRRRWR